MITITSTRFINSTSSGASNTGGSAKLTGFSTIFLHGNCYRRSVATYSRQATTLESSTTVNQEDESYDQCCYDNKGIYHTTGSTTITNYLLKLSNSSNSKLQHACSRNTNTKNHRILYTTFARNSIDTIIQASGGTVDCSYCNVAQNTWQGGEGGMFNVYDEGVIKIEQCVLVGNTMEVASIVRNTGEVMFGENYWKGNEFSRGEAPGEEGTPTTYELKHVDYKCPKKSARFALASEILKGLVIVQLILGNDSELD